MNFENMQSFMNRKKLDNITVVDDIFGIVYRVDQKNFESFVRHNGFEMADFTYDEDDDVIYVL